jgi:iron complex transport system substrate-binding protein
MKKWFITFCIIAAVMSISLICTSAQTVTVTDMEGRRVTAPFEPERIVCIGPGALRLIVYLQASSKVSGVEDMEKMNPGGRPYWIAHPELSRLPRCGPGGPASINKKPDLEAVLACKPQVIFSTYMDAPLAEEVQRTLGIPLVVLNYGAFATFDETVYDALCIAGRILNREKRAHDVVAYIDNLRKDMSKRTKDIPEVSKPEVYIGGIGYQGSRGIESTEQNYIPFKWIGAKNAAERAKASIGSHVDMDKEMLLKLNPDVIFIDSNGLSLVREDCRKKPEYYHVLKAFSNRRVYILHPFNWYATNIDTALADAYVIGKILYKKQFEDIDPQQIAEEIYTFLVGKSIVEIMERDYGLNGQMVAF